MAKSKWYIQRQGVMGSNKILKLIPRMQLCTFLELWGSKTQQLLIGCNHWRLLQTWWRQSRSSSGGTSLYFFSPRKDPLLLSSDKATFTSETLYAQVLDTNAVFVELLFLSGPRTHLGPGLGPGSFHIRLFRFEQIQTDKARLKQKYKAMNATRLLKKDSPVSLWSIRSDTSEHVTVHFAQLSSIQRPFVRSLMSTEFQKHLDEIF